MKIGNFKIKNSIVQSKWIQQLNYYKQAAMLVLCDGVKIWSIKQ